MIMTAASAGVIVEVIRLTVRVMMLCLLWPPKARPFIIFYHSNLFLFIISSALMKDQPWDLNQTWLVGQKWCRFTNAPNIFRGLPPRMWDAKHQILSLCRDFLTRHRISREQNVASTNKNARVNLQSVS